MRALDVMTHDVVTVSPDDLVQEVAKVLLRHRISGAPVVDKLGKLVGIVSEGDLMRRAETDTETQRSWWLRALIAPETLAQDYVRAHAQRVGDIMTTTVMVAEPSTPLREIAALMERNRIKRLPIVEDGQLVGIVSRANLMQAFASFTVTSPAPEAQNDQVVREHVLNRLRAESWSSPNSLNIVVREGIVELWGVVNSEAEHKAIRIAAETTPGVSSVKDNLVVGVLQSGI